MTPCLISPPPLLSFSDAKDFPQLEGLMELWEGHLISLFKGLDVMDKSPLPEWGSSGPSTVPQM